MLQSSLSRVILAAGNRLSPNDHCFLSSIAVAIAKSVDSYVVTSIARVISDTCVLIPESVIDKDLCIESI